MLRSYLVQVESLSHDYGDRLALAGITFGVKAGSCFGLLGPNGGGKTTLFRILTTMLRPTAGTARIDGFDVCRDRAAVRSRIGVVFQSPSVDPYLRVGENLRHYGHLHGLRGGELDRRIAESMDRLGVADREQDLVKTLSGGLRRRVEIAACLLHRPALLILDEPGTGLDPAARRELWDHLRQLQKREGMTILVTTHHMEEAERCDQLAILDCGRLVVAGSPAELKARIGGDCVTIAADDPAALRENIIRRFPCTPVIIGDSIRIETASGHVLAGELIREFGPAIRSVTIGKPTIEDVFIHETGHRFNGEPT